MKIGNTLNSFEHIYFSRILSGALNELISIITADILI
jgi:hypothetical protein